LNGAPHTHNIRWRKQRIKALCASDQRETTIVRIAGGKFLRRLRKLKHHVGLLLRFLAGQRPAIVEKITAVKKRFIPFQFPPTELVGLTHHGVYEQYSATPATRTTYGSLLSVW
jgi:hypothetical protein